MSLSRQAFILPITAIGHIRIGSDHVLLVGEGSVLKLFSTSKGSLLGGFLVFESQSIHGIACGESSTGARGFEIVCLAWGARISSFIRIRLSENSNGLNIEENWTFSNQNHSDWILDATFLAQNNENESKVIFLDAHNNLFSVKCAHEDGQGTACELSSYSRGPASALYSGYIKIKDSGCVLVAAGTVFGGVHLWTASGDLGRLVMMYSGHEGSVYGIKMFDVLVNETTKTMITSCSDDRTVKAWEVPETLNDSEYHSTRKEVDTGFEKVFVDENRGSALTSESGHLSRIWNVDAFSSKCLSGLVTFGEDATAQIWRLTNDSNYKSFSLLKDSTLKLHSGKNIWAGSVINRGLNNSPMVISGGADGRIVLSDVNGHLSKAYHTSVSTEDDIQSFRGHCWLDSTTLLAVTSSGSVYLAKPGTDTASYEATWQLITKSSDLSKFALLRRLNRTHALVAGSTGSVYLFSKENMSLVEISSMDRRIAFISATSITNHGQQQQEYLITLQCLGMSKMHVFRLYLEEYGQREEIHEREIIDLPTGFITTCAHVISSELMAIGSRNGSITIVELGDATGRSEHWSLAHAHGNEAVTSITTLDSTDWILSTGRDGCFKVHHLLRDGPSASFENVHSSKLPFGPDIEGAKIFDGQIHVWGFRSTNFILWNHSLQQELISIDCGGQHRAWSFYHDRISALAWTQGCRPHLAQLKSNSTILQNGSHGREIRSIAIREASDALPTIIATGAEDTCIRLSKYSIDGQLKTLDVIPIHTTGLQKLAWSRDGKYLFSAAGQEEFYVWEVQAVPVLEIGVKLISRAPAITDTRILRIMDFEVIEGQEFTIVMVYSDSSIRSWTFDPTLKLLKLVQQTTYNTRCITQCKVLDGHLLTTATDGCLILWTVEDLVQISKKRVHQSSVKCIDTIVLEDKILIASGGDDNALAITILDTRSNNMWQSLIIPKAHASALNALAFLPGQGSGIRLVTGSNDQRLKTWVVSFDQNRDESIKICVRRESNLCSSVADPNCIGLLKHGDGLQIMIAGVGMETWKLTR